MSYDFYKILHMVGIAALSLGLGGMFANSGNRKPFAILQGIGLLLMLVSGFGLLARLHLGMAHFAIVKTVLWVVLGGFPVLARKKNLPAVVSLLVTLTLVTALAYLGHVKPALW